MRLLVEYSHPAQVHKFKFVVRELIARGHSVLILSRDKGVMLELLNAEGMPHVCLSKASAGLRSLGIELLIRELRTLYHVLKFRPDVVLSAHSVAITHIAWLLRIPRIVHEDTEHARLQQALYIPFATRIVTTTAYLKDWGKRQLRINSIEQLLYLHPDYFQPNEKIIWKYGLSSATHYAVMRIINWDAAHDPGIEKTSPEEQQKLIGELLHVGFERVVLSSETPSQLSDSRIVVVDPPDFHHVLAFSCLCISEGVSVANESAVLGVPTLLVNPLITGHSAELEQFGLMRRVHSLQRAVQLGAAYLHDSKDPDTQRNRMKALLSGKEDMNEALIDLILHEGSRQRAAEVDDELGSASDR